MPPGPRRPRGGSGRSVRTREGRDRPPQCRPPASLGAPLAACAGVPLVPGVQVSRGQAPPPRISQCRHPSLLTYNPGPGTGLAVAPRAGDGICEEEKWGGGGEEAEGGGRGGRGEAGGGRGRGHGMGTLAVEGLGTAAGSLTEDPGTLLPKAPLSFPRWSPTALHSGRPQCPSPTSETERRVSPGLGGWQTDSRCSPWTQPCPCPPHPR